MNNIKAFETLLQHDIACLFNDCIEYMQLTQAIDSKQIRTLLRRKKSLLKLLKIEETKND